MKILVTGAKGMLGTDLVRILDEHNHKVFATDIEELDITQFDSLKKMASDISPDVIINCAAYTDVDKAEEEPDKAFLINGIGVRNLALVCKDLDIDLCHISTDYVFDGTKKEPYTPLDSPNPINAYGYSKLAGEKYIQQICNKFTIIRTSWLYGKYGKNFVSTILNLAKKQKELRVVNDQIGSPTWTVTLSRVIAKIIRTKKYGIYHVTDKTKNGITWYEFAKEILKISGLKIDVLPAKTGEFPRPAKRPKNSLLDIKMSQLALNEDIPPWGKSLKMFLSELFFIDKI
jgi:dTDP-4-dehydrorhamnose reductase